MISHVEAEVIEHAVARGRLRRVGRVEAQLHAREVDDRRVVARGRLPAEDARIPRDRFRNLRGRQREVDMLVTDRNRLRLVFQDFHAHAVRRFDVRLVQPVAAAGERAAREHLDARGLPLRDSFCYVADDEHRRPCAGAGRVT